MEVIAHIHTDFPGKFGVPRQSGVVPALTGKIVFTPRYRNAEALRGLQEFSHLWIIWEFSQAKRDEWHATVRPPRLGGNTRLGVFATRSPFRPNPIGLSCVEIKEIIPDTPQGPVIVVSGVDMLDGTPIFDIKPYIPYCDAHPEAKGGFTANVEFRQLTVDCPRELCPTLSQEQYQALCEVLAQDPRPHYHAEPERIYGFTFANHEIHFCVPHDGFLKVIDIK